MLVGGVERCARCGTLLRSGRRECPSCGLDQAAAEMKVEAPKSAAPMPARHETRTIPVKKSICPACMASVRDDALVEYQNSRICPDCHERIKGKLARKG